MAAEPEPVGPAAPVAPVVAVPVALGALGFLSSLPVTSTRLSTYFCRSDALPSSLNLVMLSLEPDKAGPVLDAPAASLLAPVPIFAFVRYEPAAA